MMCVELWESESGWINLESGRGGKGGIGIEKRGGGHM